MTLRLVASFLYVRYPGTNGKLFSGTIVRALQNTMAVPADFIFSSEDFELREDETYDLGIRDISNLESYGLPADLSSYDGSLNKILNDIHRSSGLNRGFVKAAFFAKKDPVNPILVVDTVPSIGSALGYVEPSKDQKSAAKIQVVCSLRWPLHGPQPSQDPYSDKDPILLSDRLGFEFDAKSVFGKDSSDINGKSSDDEPGFTKFGFWSYIERCPDLLNPISEEPLEPLIQSGPGDPQKGDYPYDLGGDVLRFNDIQERPEQIKPALLAGWYLGSYNQHSNLPFELGCQISALLNIKHQKYSLGDTYPGCLATAGWWFSVRLRFDVAIEKTPVTAISPGYGRYLLRGERSLQSDGKAGTAGRGVFEAENLPLEISQQGVMCISKSRFAVAVSGEKEEVKPDFSPTRTFARQTEREIGEARSFNHKRNIDWIAGLCGLRALTAVDIWNSAAKGYLQAQWSVSGGDRISFIPLLSEVPGGTSAMPGDGKISELIAFMKVTDIVDRRSVSTEYFRKSVGWNCVLRRLSSGDFDVVSGNVAPGDGYVEKTFPDPLGLSFPNILTHEGVPLVLGGYLGAPGGTQQLISERTEIWGRSYPNKAEQRIASLRVWFAQPDLAEGSGVVRIGAIDLEFSNGSKLPEDRFGGTLEAFVSLDPGRFGESGFYGSWCLMHKGNLDADFVLPIGAIQPSATDRVGSDRLAKPSDWADFVSGAEAGTGRVASIYRTEAPLTIPLGIGRWFSGALSLGIREISAPTGSRSLRLTVYEDRDDGAPGDTTEPNFAVAMIGREPFHVALGLVPGLKATAETTVLASFMAGTSDGSDWKVFQPDQKLTIMLPPQGIGEATIKVGDEFGVKGQDGTITGPDAPARARLPRPSKLTIDPEFADRNFTTPWWSYARLFGSANDRLPGGRLVDLNAELTYGLTLKMDSTKGAEGTWATEFLARQGDLVEWAANMPPWTMPPDFGGGFPVFEAHSKIWDAAFQAVSRRLSAITIWRPDEIDRDNWDSGVFYGLRGAADIKRPVPPLADGSGVVRSDFSKTFRDKDAGLAGGIDWGFYSSNIYEQLLRQPVADPAIFESDASKPLLSKHLLSDSGEISDLTLSALGGWARQKAIFTGGLTKIYAYVAMGRTWFYSIERIGRIGCYWHPAKHVVIYERQVAPSQQAYEDKFHENNSDPSAYFCAYGIAALRKVQEYVELIEPIRNYPDLVADKSAGGPLKTIEFSPARILVDGNWGEDVPGGWKIKLWNPAAATDETSVYHHKPQIIVHMDGHPGYGQSSAADKTSSSKHQISNPDKIYFFTSTVDGAGADTDKWPPMPGIDFADALNPTMPDNWHAADQLPPRLVEPGFSDFTWFLEPVNEVEANVLSGRIDGKTIGVGPKTFTLSRGRKKEPKTIGNLPPKAGPFDASIAGAAVDAFRDATSAKAIRTTITDAIAAANSATEFVAKAQAAIGGISTKVSDICKKLPPGQTVSDLVFSGVKRSVESLKGKAKSAIDKIMVDTLVSVNQIPNELNIDAAKTSIAGLMNAVEASVSAEIQRAGSAVSSLSGSIDPAISAVSSLQKQIDEAQEKIRQTEKSFVGATQDTLAAIKAKVISDIDSVVPQALNAIDKAKQLNSGLARVAPITATAVGTQLDQLRASVLAKSNFVKQAVSQLSVNPDLDALDKLILDAFTTLDQDLTVIQTKLSDARKDLSFSAESSIFGTVYGQVEAGQQVFHNAWSSALNSAANTTTEMVKAAIKAVCDQATGINAAIDAAFGRVDPSDAANWAASVVKNYIGAGAADKPIDPCGYLVNTLNELTTAINDFAALPIETWRSTVEGRIQQVVDSAELALNEGVEKAQKAFTDQLNDLKKPVDTFFAEASDKVEEAQKLVLERIIGDAPQLPNLDFNLDRVGYYFDRVTQGVAETAEVTITPVISSVIDAANANALKNFQINSPTLKLDGDLKVAKDALIGKLGKPPQISFSDFFGNMGGIDLSSLRAKINNTDKLGNGVSITHGFDEARRRAWLNVNVDSDLGANMTLFDFNPIALQARGVRVKAQMSAEASTDKGASLHSRHGEITSDWALQLSSQDMLVFKETTLTCDEHGSIKLNINPAKVEMAEALKFVNQLVEQYKQDIEDQGVKFLKGSDGKDVGLEASLDLPLPPMVEGTTGISGLHLYAGVRLFWDPKFAIESFIGFGTPTSPFTVTIFILGGAGWGVVAARYTPDDGKLIAVVDIALAASAMIGFNVGPASGYVQIYIGVHCHLSLPGHGGDRSIGLVFAILGEVTLWGIASIDLDLRLAAEVEDDNTIQGDGSFSATIRISRFFSRSVHQHVHRKLA